MKGKRKPSKTSRSLQSDREKAAGEPTWLPRWAPYAVFGVLSVFLFREFIVSRGLLFGTDVAALGYYARYWYAEMVRAGTFPLWNPYLFSGLPFVDAMHGDIFYPTTVLKFVMPVHRAMGWKIVLHVFVAGLVTYGWLRHLKVGRAIAIWGAVAYMLAPVMVSLVYPGHDGKLFVTALAPLALWTTDWAITRGGAWRFATLALVVALLIFTAHMQLAYFLTWGMVALVVFRLVQARRSGQTAVRVAGRFGAFALSGIVGALAIGAVQLWAPAGYLRTYSQRVAKTTGAEEARGYAYSTSWSLHLEEAFSLIVPEFVGANVVTDEGRVDTYWGRNPFKLNHEYAGLIPLLLLPLAFVVRHRRGEAWLFTGIAVVSLVYALGATTPLFRLFYWLVPGVRQFRAPSSIMFLFAVAVVTAAALGLEGAVQRGSDKDWAHRVRRFSLYLWIVTGVLLLLAVLGATGALTDLWVSILYRDIEPVKAAALQANLLSIETGLWLAALFAGLTAGAWQLWTRGTLPEAAFVGALVVLSVLDLTRVDSKFLRVIEPSLLYPKDDTTEFLLRQQQWGRPFRVLQLGDAPYGMNHFAFHGLEQAWGHHGNELGRYLDLTQGRQLYSVRVLRLLNVRFVVGPSSAASPGLPEAHRGRVSNVYELPGAYPRAYLVSDFEVVPDSLALERLLAPEFNPRLTVVLERAPDAELGSDATGSVDWVERAVNSQTLRVETDEPALLVISDNFYPAWKAWVDGVGTPVLRANYTMRAIEVPSGSHEVRFEYHSRLLKAAFWTTLVSTLLVVGLIGLNLFLHWRAQGRGQTAESSVE
ncbi:MAG: hypothetical protein JSV86_20470 [Gemmatimonadota bacterium]|nr:MAG: hypothetical protein JSV86_20470 [Gemmatimonadota bacterium]